MKATTTYLKGLQWLLSFFVIIDNSGVIEAKNDTRDTPAKDKH